MYVDLHISIHTFQPIKKFLFHIPSIPMTYIYFYIFIHVLTDWWCICVKFFTYVTPKFLKTKPLPLPKLKPRRTPFFSTVFTSFYIYSHIYHLYCRKTLFIFHTTSPHITSLYLHVYSSLSNRSLYIYDLFLSLDLPFYHP